MGLLERPYVKEIQPCLVDTVILQQVQNGTTSLPELKRQVQGIGIDLADLDVEKRVDRLKSDGHLTRDGDRIALTTDGREDIQKVLGWMRTIVNQGAVTRTGSRM